MHLFYYFTGNLALPLFLSQAGTLWSHISGSENYSDPKNIGRKSERQFFNDKRFMVPVYCTIIGGTISWLWALCLFSDEVEFNTYYLKTVRPHNWTQWIMLLYALGFISSMQTQASHELIHRREGFNKALGMFGLMNIHYIHFKDEHVMGHHKHLATIEDSSTSRLNEDIYTYMVREVYSTNKNMWLREFARIKKQHGSDCPTIAYILFNKMTWYYVIYICMWVSIYLLLGANSLKFHFIYGIYGLWYQCFANYMTHYGL